MSTKDLSQYFDLQIQKIVTEHKFKVPALSQRYLLNLLTVSAFKPQTNTYLIDLYQKGIQADNKVKAFNAFKELGDSSLILSGFFLEHILKGKVGLRYYIDMGTSAYSMAGNIFPNNIVYSELADYYQNYLVILNLISTDNTSLDSLEKMYTLWIETQSPVLKSKLIKSGFLVREIKDENT